MSSFNPISLFKIRIFCSQVRRAILLTYEKGHGNNFLTRSLVFNYLCLPHILNLRYSDYSERFKNLAKKIPVILWTVNEKSIDLKNKNEIHGIITDSVIPKDLE